MNTEPLTLSQAVRQASRQIDRLDARLLVQAVTGCTHRDLIAEPARPLDAASVAKLSALVARRAAGEPLAYLVGSTSFYGLILQVTPDVLIPRPETEELVTHVLNILDQAGNAPASGTPAGTGLPRTAQPNILDLGTGSGAIALALARHCPAATVTGLDVSAAALSVARENARRCGLAVRWLQGSWFGPLHPAERFDLIVANPPYIAAGDPHLALNGLPFEPQDALTDHADGLACIRQIVAGAPRHLSAGGGLFLEHGYDQGAAVRNLLQAAGFQAVSTWPDLAGIDRISGGCLPGAANS